MNGIPRARTMGPLMAALVGFTLTNPAAFAQELDPPRWVVSGGSGAMLPAWLYNARVVAMGSDVSFSTGYSERIRVAPLVWGEMRYRPQSDFSLFFGLEHAAASTEARYIGGHGGQQQIDRNVRITTLTAGLSVRIGEWAHGSGALDYIIAPVFTHHALDLSNGHRDVFALEFGARRDQPLQWRSRSWTGWGLALGVTARFPLARDLGLRAAVNGLVIPTAAGELALLEADEVERLTGRRPVFQYSSFTTYYPSIRIGVDYVLSRLRPRAQATATLPPPAIAAEESAETRAALEAVAHGDTAAAIDALRARVREAPHDASAWRELALLLAAAAEVDPTLTQQAWEALQRAVMLNPDDAQVLAAYGRARAMAQRTQTVMEAPVRTFTMSDVAVRADAAGELSVAVGASGLPVSEDGRVRYRVTIEVVDPAGERVPLRLADAPDSTPTTALDLERVGDSPSIAERIELRLGRARPGAHTVRVRITSLISGQSMTRVAGFEIR